MIRLCNEAFLHRNRMDIQGNVYKRVGEELNIDELESRKVCVRSPQDVSKLFADIPFQIEFDSMYCV